MKDFPKEVILYYVTKYITDDYRVSPNEDWININSVFMDDSKYRMGICFSKNYVNDFKLGQNWHFTEFVAEYEEISLSNAKAKLFNIYLELRKKGKLEFITPQQPKIIEAVSLDELPSLLVPPMKKFDSNVLKNKVGKTVWKYLLKRHIGPEHIKKFGLQYVDQYECFVCGGAKEINGEECKTCKGSGKNFYYGRIIIPTYENGNLVYFQARDISDNDRLKYLNPSTPRMQVVYFYDLLKENTTIYITEGPIDAMTLLDYNCTCTMGNRISDPQIFKLMRKNPTEIIFIPDYDETKEKRAIINKALKKNIKRLMYLTDNTIKIGIYQWFKKWNGKDLNKAQVTFVDQSLIKYVSSFKEQVKEKLDHND